jgi:hypothetical protein
MQIRIKYLKILKLINRKSMLKDSGFSCIEQYMFDEDPMLRKAATECICNLVQEEEVILEDILFIKYAKTFYQGCEFIYERKQR